MLEFDGGDEAVRPGDGPGRVHVRRSAGPAHRLPRPQRRRQDDGHARGVRAGRARRRERCAGTARRSAAAERARFGYMPEERGLYPRMRVRDQLVYLGQLCGRRPKDVTGSVDTWLERLGLAERAADRLDALSHGNQQRVQLIAALVNEPDLLVLDEPFSGLDPIAIATMAELLAELAAGGATVLFSSHQLDLVEDLCEDVVIIDHGRIVLAGDLADLRAAVPQRFVDIRYRGPAPDWSALAAGEVVESGDGHARLRVGQRHRPGRGAGPGRRRRRRRLVHLPAADAVGAVPPGGGGMNGLRQSWLVARREMRERSRSRAFRASVVLMILAVAALLVLPALLEPSSTKDVGLTGSAPAGAGCRHRPVRPARSAPRPASTATPAWPPASRPSARASLDVLVVDARRLEWQRRADEQLKAVVTGAIQLVTVRERAAAAGISPGALAALLTPVPVTNVELGPGAGPQPRRRDGRPGHDRRAVLLHQHLRADGAEWRGGGEGQPRRRGAPRPDARPQPAGRQDRRHRPARAGPDRRDRTGRARRRHHRPTPSTSPPSRRRAGLGRGLVRARLRPVRHGVRRPRFARLTGRGRPERRRPGHVVLIVGYFVSFATIGSPPAPPPRRSPSSR